VLDGGLIRVKIDDLYAQLGELISAGRGDDDVYLVLNDGAGDEEGPARDVGRWAWALTYVQPAEDRDAFTSLCGEVETPEMEAQTTFVLREQQA
jgi:hypothetical protein